MQKSLTITKCGGVLSVYNVLTADQIIEHIAASQSDEMLRDNEELNNELKSLLATISDPLTIHTELNSYEVELTGQKLANWIQPLHFEKNLNSAIDSLEAVEKLIKEIKELVLISISLNSIENDIENKPNRYRIHKELVKNLELVKSLKNLEFKLSKKIIDLIEYTKASKIGAKVLFGLDEEQFEYSGGLPGLSKIRESLRKLLLKYRTIRKSDQELVVPISLKKAKNKSKNWLIDKWTDESNQRENKDGLKQGTIEFDLSLYSDIETLKYQRIRKVGIQVVDYNALLLQKASDTEKRNPQDYWNITLSDMDNGVKLGESALSRYVPLKPILFKCIQSGIQNNNIEWSSSNSLLNFNANRKWKLEINEESHIGTKRENIRDIIIHFHLSAIRS